MIIIQTLFSSNTYFNVDFNPLNSELNPICYLLALFEAHQILYISRTRVNLKLNETAATDYLLTLFSILYTTIAGFFLHTHVSSQCLTMPGHQYQCQLPLVSRYRYGQNSSLRFGIRYFLRIIEYVTRIQRIDKSMNAK
jgi:hypothetical protein